MERHWLSAGCGVVGDPLQKWVENVFAVDGWSVATNLKALVAVRDGGEAAEQGQPPPDRNRVHVAAMLAAAPVDPAAVEVGDLRRWCGYPKGPACEWCGGHGWMNAGVDEIPDGHEHLFRVGDAGAVEVQCYDCEGSGEGVRRSAGRVCGAVVDKDLILSHTPGLIAESRCLGWRAELPAKSHKGQVQHGLYLSGATGDGAEWRVVVSEISPPALAEQDVLGAKTPPVYVPGIGALWHLIDSGGRFVVADWLADRGLNIEQIDPLPF